MRSEAKWAQSLRSFATEITFYTDFYGVLSPRVALVRPLLVQAAAPSGGGGDATCDSFLLLLEDVEAVAHGGQALDCLDAAAAQRALVYLADLHAVGATAPHVVDQAARTLWPNGGWWHLERVRRLLSTFPLWLADF